jgi:hypothetical protein
MINCGLFTNRNSPYTFSMKAEIVSPWIYFKHIFEVRHILKGGGERYAQNDNFLILRYICLNSCKLYNSNIWYTSIYEFSVPSDSFHRNILVNRFLIIFLLKD